jgi:hypothetical protein
METGRGDLLGRGGNSFEETPDKNLSTATGEKRESKMGMKEEFCII